MKFICNKTEISEAISNVSRAVSQKSTIPALEGIKVRVSSGSVELTAYNLEMGIRTSINANTGFFKSLSRRRRFMASTNTSIPLLRNS